MLRYEATRRPDIKVLLDRAGSLTDAEIATAPVPLPWFRSALTMARAAARAARVQHDARAFITAHTRIASNPDPDGEVRLWSLPSTYLRDSRGGDIEMREGRHLFLPDSGGVWIGIMYSSVVDPLVARANVVGRMSLTAYKHLNDATAERDCPPNSCVIDITGGNQTAAPGAAPHLAAMGVRFFR